MRMVATEKIWTEDDLATLPDDGNRYEIIDGELFVTPSPAWRHQTALKLLVLVIDPYLVASVAGDLQVAPADVVFDKRNVVEPDLFVVPLVNGRRPKTWQEAGRLLLAIEIVSPSSARQDRVAKRWLYQGQEVPEYWVIDVDATLVERWRPGDERPEILTDRLDWQPSAEHAPLSIDLVAYFRDVRGE
jgi:Uma2 family endonuclease